jgi:hypothetical protein
MMSATHLDDQQRPRFAWIGYVPGLAMGIIYSVQMFGSTMPSVRITVSLQTDANVLYFDFVKEAKDLDKK